MLEKVRLDLRIDDGESDARLLLLIDQGKAYLNDKAGGVLDYSDGVHERLLLSYVRYAYNDASEFFLERFLDDITSMQQAFAIGVMANANA